MPVKSCTVLKEMPVVADGSSLEKACNQTSYGPDDDIGPNHIEDHMVARAFEDSKVEQKDGQFKDGERRDIYNLMGKSQLSLWLATIKRKRCLSLPLEYRHNSP